MIAVQSLWTRPKGWWFAGAASRHGGSDAMWMLSALRLRALVDAGHFEALWLITDAQGAEWARGLGLPYQRIVEALDALPAALESVWAAGKLEAHRILSDDGLCYAHFDGDVTVKEALPGWFTQATVFVERADNWCPCGQGNYGDWQLPEAWRRALDACSRLSWGCGLVGCRNGALGDYAATALRVLNDNASLIENGTGASIFAEQWGLGREVSAREVAMLLPHGAMAREASAGRYYHAGGPVKRERAWQRRVMASLKSEWPQIAARLAG
jgi:hypothetical protein